jgi:hypothetical protein
MKREPHPQRADSLPTSFEVLTDLPSGVTQDPGFLRPVGPGSAKGPAAGLHTEEELRITRRRGSVLRAFLKSASSAVDHGSEIPTSAFS